MRRIKLNNRNLIFIIVPELLYAMGSRQSHSQNILYYSEEDFRNSVDSYRMRKIKPNTYKNCSDHAPKLFQCNIAFL